MNASGCGVTVREYGHSLRLDPDYAEKARRVSELTRDLSELLPDIVAALQRRSALPRSAGERGGGAPSGPASEAKPRSAGERGGGAALPARRVKRIAFHPPCTLQHGQQLRGHVETGLSALGFDVVLPVEEAHLCCGSAGTYSLLQPELAGALRERKLGHLAGLEADVIASANIGCIQHLQSGTATPVRHWVEVLDEELA